MVYAQIRQNLIMNIIRLDDPSLEPLFKEGYEYLIRVDQLDPIPQIGWIYDYEQQTFVPVPTEEEVQAAILTPEADTPIEQTSWWSNVKSFFGWGA